MIYVAEFNKNKNQQLLLHALALIKDEMPNCKLLLVGDGPEKHRVMDKLRDMPYKSDVLFLGKQENIAELQEML